MISLFCASVLFICGCFSPNPVPKGFDVELLHVTADGYFVSGDEAKRAVDHLAALTTINAGCDLFVIKKHRSGLSDPKLRVDALSNVITINHYHIKLNRSSEKTRDKLDFIFLLIMFRYGHPGSDSAADARDVIRKIPIITATP